ncbi:MAG: GNAT family N-acetyltransferase [Candidatus Zixiibacteriota bacterium]
MLRISHTTEFDECRRLWNEVIPPARITDLWDVRAKFHRHYKNRPFFVYAEENGRIVGLLPLSYIASEGYYGYFPGELWHGKTWLEQNRIIAEDQHVFEAMQKYMTDRGKRVNIRYVLHDDIPEKDSAVIDEIGYLFYPKNFDYMMENYFNLFSGKSEKRIRREIEAFEQRGVEIRSNNLSDFSLMIQMNRDRYGADSYFADDSFVNSLREMMLHLHKNDWLRITSVLVEGQYAAIDMGVIYNNIYTLFAGGTSAAFPGIAKYINLYHMRLSCQEQFDEVDFLCGDFSWKPMFHLSPRPLYQVRNIPALEAVRPAMPFVRPIEPVVGVELRG